MLDNSQLTCGVEAQRVPALPAGLDYGHDHAYGLAMATVVLHFIHVAEIARGG